TPHRLPALPLRQLHRRTGACDPRDKSGRRHALSRRPGPEVRGRRPGGRSLRAQGHPGRGRPAGVRPAGRLPAAGSAGHMSQRPSASTWLPATGLLLVLLLWWVGATLLALRTPIATVFAPLPTAHALVRL